MQKEKWRQNVQRILTINHLLILIKRNAFIIAMFFMIHIEVCMCYFFFTCYSILLNMRTINDNDEGEKKP